MVALSAMARGLLLGLLVALACLGSARSAIPGFRLSASFPGAALSSPAFATRAARAGAGLHHLATGLNLVLAIHHDAFAFFHAGIDEGGTFLDLGDLHRADFCRLVG